MDPIDPTLIYWALMILLGGVAAVSSINGMQSRNTDKQRRDDDKISNVSADVKVVGADVKATREIVTDMKGELKAQSEHISKLDSKLSNTDQVAKEALDKANAAHERMDAMGMPSAYAARCGILPKKETRQEEVDDGGVGTTSAGGGAAHNNMPPYEVAYCWKRIS